MASSTFYGAQTLIYPDYLDVATGKTLVVHPGSAYTVTVASGRHAAAPATPGDGRWVQASGVSLEAPSPVKDPLKIPAPSRVPDSEPEGEAK